MARQGEKRRTGRQSRRIRRYRLGSSQIRSDFFFLFRQAASDYTVAKGTDHATTIKAGTYVLAVTQSAMFDAKAFNGLK
jgi:hypothetical protein